MIKEKARESGRGSVAGYPAKTERELRESFSRKNERGADLLAVMVLLLRAYGKIYDHMLSGLLKS